VARCLGTIHDFVTLDAISATSAARAAIDQANEKIRDAFKGR